jgi:hypothetical protein
METLILRGNSKQNSRLLLQLATQLKFKAKKLSKIEVEEMGLALSIFEGLNSGILDKNETSEFLKSLSKPSLDEN